MAPQQELNGLFRALKQVLKTQGLRYRDLAVMLETSEVTVKRLFQEQDCKMSRLTEICEVLGISLTELMSLAEHTPTEPSTLSTETEQALAEKPALFSCLVLLLSGFSSHDIAHANQLSQADIYRYMRELEKLQLLRLGKNNSVHLTVQVPIRWRLDGPLHQMLVQINQAFIEHTINEQHSGNFPFFSTSRLLSQHSAKQLQEEVNQLYQRFQKQASLDQLFYPVETLVPYKMVTTLAPFTVSKFFELPPFDEQP